MRLTLSALGLASELIQGRYQMPATMNPDSLVSKHENGLIKEAQHTLSTLGNAHRSIDFNRLLLPSCRPIVEAIGHRLAYDAAIEENVHPALLQLYECEIIGKDIGWYIENKLVSSRAELRARECSIVDSLEGEIESMIQNLSIKDYVRAPILSDSSWATFVEELPLMTESESVKVLAVDYIRDYCSRYAFIYLLLRFGTRTIVYYDNSSPC